MALVFNAKKVIVMHLFIILVIVSLGCVSAEKNSCDCVLGSYDKFERETDYFKFYWRKPNLMMFPWEVDVYKSNDNVEDPYVPKSPCTIKDLHMRFSCRATLISNKHVLAPASCVLPSRLSRRDDAIKSTTKFRLSYINVHATASIIRKVSNVYVHPNYFKDNVEISILELNEGLPIGHVQPAILPTTLIFDSAKLPVAIAIGMEEYKRILQPMNVSIWSNDQCAKYTGVTTENLMCVEVGDLSDICDDNSFGFSGPVFHVLKNDREEIIEEIIGIPKGCIYQYMRPSDNMTFDKFKLVNYTNEYRPASSVKLRGYIEKKSVIVYTRVTHYLAWIQNILSNRCLCGPKDPHLVDLQSVVFQVNDCIRGLEFRYEAISLRWGILE